MIDARALRLGPIEWSLLLLLSLLWGGTFFFAEIALRDMRPFTIVAGRVIIAALALNLLMLATGRRMPRDLASWRRFLVMGALNNAIPFSLIFWGQTQITAGLASILNSMTPVFTVLLAHWLTADERLSAGRVLGVILGIAGAATMIGIDAMGGLGLHAAAEGAVLLAAFVYGLAGIYGRRFRADPPLVTATGQLTASAILMAPVAIMVDRPWTAALPGIEPLAALVGLALLSTALAYVIYFRILAAAGATNLLLVTFMIPPSAILMGYFLLGERLAWNSFLGLGLILAGLLAVSVRRPVPWRR